MTPRKNTVSQRLKDAGITQAEIARHLGVCRQTVSRVVNGQKSSKRIQTYIAGLLGDTVFNLFKERSRA